ncbi:hypothetical protein F5Y06DRAFT_306658 [Hypoxylon sp. FL0890]|nr:hypothetical protein F5Y06DRAFT_306658 [Hypoxylon sp. FL0890]
MSSNEQDQDQEYAWPFSNYGQERHQAASQSRPAPSSSSSALITSEFADDDRGLTLTQPDRPQPTDPSQHQQTSFSSLFSNSDNRQLQASARAHSPAIFGEIIEESELEPIADEPQSPSPLPTAPDLRPPIDPRLLPTARNTNQPFDVYHVDQCLDLLITFRSFIASKHPNGMYNIGHVTHPSIVFMYPLPRRGYDVFLFAQRTAVVPAETCFDHAEEELWREMADVALMGVRGGLRYLPGYDFAVRFVRVRSSLGYADVDDVLREEEDVVGEEEYWGKMWRRWVGELDEE